MAVVATIVQAGLDPRGRCSTPRPWSPTAWSRSRALSSSTTTPSRTCRSASRCCSSTPPRSSWSAGCGSPRGAGPRNLTLAGVALAIAGSCWCSTSCPAHTSTSSASAGGWPPRSARRATSSCPIEVSAGRRPELNSITLAAGGLVVGAAAVALLGVTGVMPLTFTANDTVVAGAPRPGWCPSSRWRMVPTAIAYTPGHHGHRPAAATVRLARRSVRGDVRRAGGVALLGEAITLTQAVGGAVVLVGLALARQAFDRTEKVARATWPDGPAGDD